MRNEELTNYAGFNLKNNYLKLPEIFFTRQNPSMVPNPTLIILNDKLASILELDASKLKEKCGVDILAGNIILKGTTPIAEAYAGHQFGNFTMLGDGRAILLGEQMLSSGKSYDIHLKGAGRTKYSRGGDGKASLGPMLREYIISEAMYNLGIPTTRSLAVVTTGEGIYREEELPGAILARIASSHIRVGTFQYASNWGTTEELKALADYTIEKHYPEGINKDNKYLYLLKEVIKRQAELISKWQLVGFIHGVMNTDNMTISGETIDYGPCSFMDIYDPTTVFSSIDIYGRYAYGNQPNIASWNLARFAETLIPILHNDRDEAIKLAQNEISKFSEVYKKFWIDGMKRKLGIFGDLDGDEYLVENLLEIMKKYKSDYTNTFRLLTISKIETSPLYNENEFKLWYSLWENRLKEQEQSMDEAIELMQKNNPIIIPRNHRVEEALEAAVRNGNFKVMEKLLEALSDPYNYSKDLEEYTKLAEPSDKPYRTYCGT